MSRRIHRLVLVVLVVLVVLAASVVGCSSGGPDGSPTSASARSTPTSAATTGTVALDLPEAAAPVLVTAPQVGLTDGAWRNVVAADADGLWFIRSSATGWSIDRVDPVGAPVRSIDLPGSAYRPEVRAVGDEVVWVAGRMGDDPSVVEFGLVRVDLATGEAALVPTPGFVTELEADGETVWAIMQDGDDAVQVQGYTATGPTGEATRVAKAEEGALGALFTVTDAATYDCLIGAWGVTPHGGEREDLGTIGDGCNTVPVGREVLITADGELLRLGPEGETAPIDVGRAVDSCTGSRQASTAPVLVLCAVETDATTVGAGHLVVRITPDRADGEVVDELGLDPAIGLTVRGVPDARVPGDPVALLEESRDLSPVRSIVVGEAADGTITWQVVDPAVLPDQPTWLGTSPWYVSRDGEWRQVAVG